MKIFKIKTHRLYRNIFCVSLILLAFLLIKITFPTIIKQETASAASGTATPSTLNLTVTNPTLSLSVVPSSANGTFASSADMGIAVSTDNFTGYTLSIRTNTNVDNDKLIHSNLANCKSELGYGTSEDESEKCYINSISSNILATNFSDSSSSGTQYNNQWGYKPSKINGVTNSTDTYYSAPTTSQVIESTTQANSTDNTYTVSIGARIDNTIPYGTYSNTFIIEAVANEINYSISFNNNTGDSSVSNLPTTLASSTSSTTIALPQTTPTRTGYNFSQWCLGAVSSNGTVCTGTTYDPSTPTVASYFGIDQTASNTNISLYAVWTPINYTCSKQYRLQNADGSYPDVYTSDGSEQIAYGGTCTYSKSVSYYTTASTSNTVTGDITLSVDLPRTEYYLTVNRNTTYISSATGSGYYRWGDSATIIAGVASNGRFTGWTQTAGTTSTFANASYATTTFVMPQSNATVYANGESNLVTFNDAYAAAGKSMSSGYYTMQTMNSSICASVTDQQTGNLKDTRSGNIVYTVAKIGSKCWMTTNLNLGGSSSISLTSSNSNVSSSYTLPASSTSNFTTSNSAKAAIYKQGGSVG